MDCNNSILLKYGIIYWLINYLCTCVISVQYTQHRLFVIISTNLYTCTWCNEQVTSVVFTDVRVGMMIIHYRLYIHVHNILCCVHYIFVTMLYYDMYFTSLLQEKQIIVEEN